jgi:hypothetical protein
MTKKDKKKWCPYISKKIGNIIHVFDPIYMVNFYAIVGVSNKEFCKAIKQDIKLTLPSSDSDGKFYEIERHGQKVGLIWSTDKTEHLTHECFHATSWALRKKGLYLGEDSEEAFSYYQQFLIKAIRSIYD